MKHCFHRPDWIDQKFMPALPQQAVVVPSRVCCWCGATEDKVPPKGHGPITPTRDRVSGEGECPKRPADRQTAKE